MRKFKLLSLVLLLFPLFFGCVKDESPTVVEDSLALRAQQWYESEHSGLLENNPNFYGEPDWENIIHKDEKLYIPLFEKITLQKQLALDNQKVNLLFTKAFLVLKIDESLDFNESLKVFVSANNDNFQNVNTVLNLSYLEYDANNDLNDYSFKEDSIDIRITEQSLKGSTLSAKCVISEYLVQTDTYTDGSKEVYIIGVIYKCDGNGGGNGSGGDGSDGNLALANETPPSCNSFNFVKTGSNWQEAVVNNIYFKVYLTYTTPPYLEYSYTVKLEQPVSFGAPLKDRYGNILSAGKLASASAYALHDTMKDTVDKFDRVKVNPDEVERFFKTRLRENYPLHIIGGRANTNSSSNLPATNYKATTRSDFDGCK